MKKISLIFAFLLTFVALGNKVQAQCTDGNYDCYLVFDLQDSYGDGWNSNTLTVSQNDVTLATLTLNSGSSGVDTVRVCTEGGAITITYNPVGNYQTENTFTVTDSLGSVLCSGSGSTAGSTYEVAPCPTCPAPGALTAAGVTSSSANVYWTELGEASLWVYQYGVNPYPSGTWQQTSVPNVSINGLNSNTLYYFFVKSACGSDDTSAASQFSFRTECGPVSLPYTEGFESYDETEQIPFCWRRWEDGFYYSTWSGYTYYPNVYSYDGHSGSNSLYFYPYYGTQSVMLPKVPVTTNGIELVLWANGPEALQVGYVTTTDSATAVFHQVGTVGPSDDTVIVDEGGYSYTEYIWSQFTVPFDTVTADSIYIVLRATGTIDYNTLYVDDIVIREINNCPIPTNLHATSNASGEITLSWNSASGSQWEVAYGPVGFNPDGVTSYLSSSTTSLTINDLDDQTTYEFYVRTVCGSQYGYWSLSTSARPNVYTVSAMVDTVTSCGITIVDDGGLFGTASMGIQQTIVLMPSEAGSTIRLRGNALMYSDYSSYYPNVMRIYAGTDTTGNLLATVNSVDQYGIDITSEVGAMTIVFSNSDNTYYAAEGFEFYVSCEELPDCTTPFGLEVSNIVGNGATVSWQYDTALGQAPGFLLVVNNGAGEEVANYPVEGSARSYTLNGLNERTNYTVQLILDCEGIDTLSVSFATVCNAGGEAQISEGTTTTSYLPTYIYYGNTLSQQILLASDLEGIGTLYGVSFYMTSSNTYTRAIDIYVDTTSIAAYASADDYVVPSASNRYYSGSFTFEQGWNEFLFDSGFVVPAGKNIVLTVNDHSNVYSSSTSFRKTNTSDNRCMYSYRDYNSYDPTDPTAMSGATLESFYSTIKAITPCSDNGCIPPVITNMEVDESTVTLTWTPGGDETAWKVEYHHVDTATWTVVEASTTATSYTFTGLLPHSLYGFRISSICGENLAARTTSATTLCGREALPFTEDFEAFVATSYNDDVITDCWFRGSNYPYNSYYPYLYSAYYDPQYAHSGSNSLSYGGYNAYLVLPRMEARVDSLNVSFWAYNSNPSAYDVTMEVGVCTDPAVASTFTVVASRQTNDGQWQLVDIDLDSYTGADGNIFIRIQNAEYAYFYIDDITVTRLPDCRRVSDVLLSSVTDNSATLTLVDNNSYGNYTVYYSTDNDMETADTLNFTGNSVTITGLAGNTQYYAWMVSRCSASSESNAFTVEPFYTLCTTPIVVTDDDPYLFEFETGRLDCMEQESTSGLMWVNSTGTEDYTNYAHAISGGHMARIAAEDNSTAKLILPTFDFSMLSGNAEFSFYRYQYQNTLSYYTTYPLGQLEVYYRVGTTGSWTLLSAIDSAANTWEKFTFTLPSSQGATAYQVAINGKPMGNVDGIFIDDVKVKAPATCFKPVNVTVSNITDRTATVSWAGGNAAAYKVQYRPQGNLSWNARNVTGADECVISPLSMATQYEVRVIGICSGFDQSEPSDVVVFSTDFCTDRQEGSNFTATSTDATSTVSPVDVSKNYSYSEILVDAATLAGMTNIDGFSFYIDNVGGAANMTDCQIYMGHTTASTMTAFLYDSTFVQVYNGDIGSSVTGERRITLQNPFAWDGTSNLVVGIFFTGTYDGYSPVTFAAHQTTDNKVYYGGRTGSVFTPAQANMLSSANRGASNNVPDLSFYGCNPVCNAPVISAVNTTANTIEVVWYNEGGVVEVAIKPTAETSWDVPAVCTDNRYTFENLPGMTSFDIRLRRDCTAEELDYSDWVYTTVLTDTACSIPDNLAVTAVTGTTATLSWTDGPMNGNVWEVHVWNSNINKYYDVTTNPVTIDGLVPGSSYRAEVRAYCGSDNHVVGEYSDAILFDNVCQPVTNLSATANGNSVVLHWNAGEHNTQWLVSYGYYGFAPNEQLGYMIVNTNSATITGLGSVKAPYSGKGVDDNRYSFRVRAICADGWNSVWSADASVNLTGIDEVEDASTRFALQPNPATDRVVLHLNDFEGVAEVSILSVDGRRMFDLSTSNASMDFDVSSLPAGTYFVRVQTDSWTAVRKLVVR